MGQARKESTKINFWGPETARWGGGLPREGVVAEKFVPSLESLSSLGFGERNLGCPGNSAGNVPDPWGCSKSLCKKFVCIFRSLFGTEFVTKLVPVSGNFRDRIRATIIGRTPRGHTTARFLEGFLECSLKEVLLRRVLRRRLVRASIETEVLGRVLRRGGVIEGA